MPELQDQTPQEQMTWALGTVPAAARRVVRKAWPHAWRGEITGNVYRGGLWNFWTRTGRAEDRLDARLGSLGRSWEEAAARIIEAQKGK